MRVRILVALVVLLAIAVPAQAKAGGFGGIVIAKQPQRAMLILSAPNGVGLSVRTQALHVRVGDRVTLTGLRLGDGTISASRLRVLSHTRRAVIRGVVVRQLRRSTLVATGHSVIAIHHQAARRVASLSDDGGIRVGSRAEFQVRIDDDNLLQQAAVTPLGQAANVQIEGSVVSVSPLVVSVEGLPITITVPQAMTLPPTLAAGARIELTVMAAAGNVFTLVSIDEIEGVNPVVAPNQEVEVKGFVVGSTATQLVVNSGGAMFTFAAATGVTLPTLAVGTFVEVRGVSVNGVLTLTRLKLEDTEGDGGSGGDGGGQGGSGGGDDGGGHSGGGDHGGGD